MRNKGYLFLVLIFLVCILSVSAVSAAEDLASDINTDDSQELILEENKTPHNWKNPVWRHADGSIAEW